MEDEFFYSISPDGYNKDDISVGKSDGVKHSEWMPPVMNFQWSENKAYEPIRVRLLESLPVF